MKKFILVFILSSNFIFSQAETSQNQIDELINGIAKLISKNNSIKSEKFYYKEVLNVTDIVNSSSNGGAAYHLSEIYVIPGANTQVTDNLFHQVGHSFATLADEYENESWLSCTGRDPAAPRPT